jgi:hypothetical protein
MVTTPTATEAAALDHLRLTLEAHFDSEVALKFNRDAKGNLTATFTDEYGDLDLTIEPCPHDKAGGWWGYNAAEYDGDDPVMAGVGFGRVSWLASKASHPCTTW